VCWRKLKIITRKFEENSENIHEKYIGIKQVKSSKMQAAEQDQTAATRTVAHKRIKISVNTQ
jgi:hypothetical protein